MLLRPTRLYERKHLRADKRDRHTTGPRLHELANLLAIILRGLAARFGFLPARCANRRTSRSHKRDAVRLVPGAGLPVLLPMAITIEILLLSLLCAFLSTVGPAYQLTRK